MEGFNTMSKTLAALEGYLESINQIIIKSESDPEILLTERFLPYDIDRQYILSNLLIGFGEEAFSTFILEYFNKITSTLAWRIPIDDVVLKPEIYGNDYRLIGYIDDVPRIVINTFAKTVEYIEDDTRKNLVAEQSECLQLISDLEEQLNMESVNIKKSITKSRKEKQREQVEILIAQLGVEKQNLSKINEEIEAYDNANAFVKETIERYISRLTSYYKFSRVKQEDSEQYTQESE